MVPPRLTRLLRAILPSAKGFGVPTGARTWNPSLVHISKGVLVVTMFTAEFWSRTVAARVKTLPTSPLPPQVGHTHDHPDPAPIWPPIAWFPGKRQSTIAAVPVSRKMPAPKPAPPPPADP